MKKLKTYAVNFLLALMLWMSLFFGSALILKFI